MHEVIQHSQAHNLDSQKRKRRKRKVYFPVMNSWENLGPSQFDRAFHQWNALTIFCTVNQFAHDIKFRLQRTKLREDSRKFFPKNQLTSGMLIWASLSPRDKER